MRKVLIMFFVIIMIFLLPISTEAKEKDTYISETAYEACIKYGEQYAICPEMLMAIIEKESEGNHRAENGSCKGLMQISVRWHRGRMEHLGVTDIFDEEGNILVGADYLAELFEEHEEAAVALMTYNGDSRALEDGYISDYARWILNRSAELERIHGK